MNEYLCMNIRKIREKGADGSRVFGSSAFTDVIFSRTGTAGISSSAAEGDIEIRVSAAGISPTQTLCIVGSCDALGCWQPEHSVELADSEFPIWSVRLSSEKLPSRFEYKFIVRDRLTKDFVAWEEGCNRIFEYAPPSDGETAEIEVRAFDNPVKWHGAGVAIPVFSLRSEGDFGIGEFRDLCLLADWAAATGQCIIQILPVNDTTHDGSWRDSYPYSANSAFALHPQYISLKDVGILKDPAERERFDRIGQELNMTADVDYEQVNRMKHEYLHAVYDECGEETLHTEDYDDFFTRNASWLVPYSAYSVLRDLNGTSDFSSWGEYAVYDSAKIERFSAEYERETGYYRFVQYHLHRQLRAARDYVHSRGVILKGDIPIGISRTSADAWVFPEFLHMDSSAGAPPDDFSVKGQNWGFPTYDWQRMAQDGYAWWRARLAKMSDYFDAYRIDHILGFFRIWEIPDNAVSALAGHFNPAMPFSEAEISSYGFEFDRAHHTAPVSESENVLFIEDPRTPDRWHPRIAAHSTEIYGHLSDKDKKAFDRLYDDFYYRRHNDFWRRSAMDKLVPLISATRMLVCGEDLGMIPACVPDVMRELQILSLEIERMPKTFGTEFDDTGKYPYLSVCSPSTHDMSNIRLWWQENTERSKRYLNDILGIGGDITQECPPRICEMIIRRQLDAASILTVIPLQDWLSTDGELRRSQPSEERINDPSDPHRYWRYRMHLTLETLSASDGFNSRIGEMICASGRRAR